MRNDYIFNPQRHTMTNPALANSCHGNSPYFFSMEHNVYVLASASFLLIPLI